MKWFCRSSLLLVAVAGCVTSGNVKWSPAHWNLFARQTEEDHPEFADTKAAHIRRIQDLADTARDMSPAEKMSISTKLAEQLRAESDELLQLETVRALGAFSTPGAIEGLRHALTSEQANIRIAACRSLSRIRSAQSLEILSDVARGDSNLDVRAAAVRALGEFEGEPALRALAAAVDDRDPAIQFLAVQSLRKVHGENLGDNLSVWRDFARRILHQPADTGAAAEVAELPANETTR
jgi:HEAT repeat protein